MDVALVDHLGRVEEDVLLVAEGLDQEPEKPLDGEVLGLEALGPDGEVDHLFDLAVDDVVPPVLRQAVLDWERITMMNSRISDLSILVCSSGQASPYSLTIVRQSLSKFRN